MYVKSRTRTITFLFANWILASRILLNWMYCHAYLLNRFVTLSFLIKKRKNCVLFLFLGDTHWKAGRNDKIKLCMDKLTFTYLGSLVTNRCEVWSLRLREERRLRVFENRILKRIFGPKRDVNVKWRRLYHEELHSFYRSSNSIVRVIKSRRLR